MTEQQQKASKQLATGLVLMAIFSPIIIPLAMDKQLQLRVELLRTAKEMWEKK